MKLNNEDRQYLVIHHPVEDDGGRYLLVVSRSAGSLFGGGGQVIYSVDEIKVNNGIVAGYLDAQLVAQFPSRLDYLLVRRDRAEFLTPEEAAEKQAGIDKRLRDAMKKYEGLDPEDGQGLTAATARGFQYL